MNVGKVCNHEVILTGINSSLADVAGLMRRYHVGTVIVVEEENGRTMPVGIVTDRDLVVKVLAEGVDADTVALADLMSRNPLIVTESDDINTALNAMRDRGVRRVPVVDAEGDLSGVLSIDDLLWELSRSLDNIVSLLVRQPRVEARRQAN